MSHALSLRGQLEHAFAAALRSASGVADAEPMVQRASKPQFGHYQMNGIMKVAKQSGTRPRDLAATVLDRLDASALGIECEIAGPGFINIRFTPPALTAWLEGPGTRVRTRGAWLDDAQARTVVVDYSAPNLAKEMHVGHLRSTLIGDAVVRVLEHLGHRVIRQNHVGDWGTQFGMLITRLEESGDADTHRELADLEQFYQAAKRQFDEDPDFADRARRAVVALQSGEPRARALWHRFIDASLDHAQAIYDRLGVTLDRSHVMAESAYNDMLPGIVEDLQAQALVQEDDGALVAFMEEFKGRDDEPLAVIVRKQDGGYLYATTDLAAARYRHETLDADRALYFVDARQSLHLQSVFALARKAGFVDERPELTHCPFGVMLGSDGKPFRTRAGGTVKLMDLLDEAASRARALIEQREVADREFAPAETDEIARQVALAAIKYADLSKHRTSDYVFDWDTMLSFEGDTGPYLQYATTRLKSLLRLVDDVPDDVPLRLAEPGEVALALKLAQLGETLGQTAQDACPHLLCQWLFDTATAFSRFYDQCPVLKAEPDVRAARVQLCRHALAALTCGLTLLGIETPDRM